MGKEVIAGSIYFKKLMEHLVEYNGIIFHFKSMSTQYINAYKKRTPAFTQGFILGSHLIYRHPITLKHTWGHTIYQINKKNLQVSVNNIRKYISNYFAAQAYEVFETYLYDVTSKAAILYPENIKKVKSLLKNTNQKDYRSQLKSRYKNCYELYRNVTLKLLPVIEDDLKNKFKHYRTFESFLKSYSLARNCITHSHGLIKKEQLTILNNYEEKLLETFYGLGAKKGKTLHSIDTSEDINIILTTLAQLASLIDNYLIKK